MFQRSPSANNLSKASRSVSAFHTAPRSTDRIGLNRFTVGLSQRVLCQWCCSPKLTHHNGMPPYIQENFIIYFSFFKIRNFNGFLKKLKWGPWQTTWCTLHSCEARAVCIGLSTSLYCVLFMNAVSEAGYCPFKDKFALANRDNRDIVKVMMKFPVFARADTVYENFA